MTRLTSDERAAIQAELDSARAEIARLQSLLDSQPDGSDGDTIRLLQPLCRCGLPLDHRHPVTGEPRPCSDETARIALAEGRTRPPVPMSTRAAEAIAGLVELDMELRSSQFRHGDESRLIYCCEVGANAYPQPCPAHGPQVSDDVIGQDR